MTPLVDLDSLAVFWQRQLRLQDWTVSLLWTTYLDLDQCYGLSRVNRPVRHAFIRIARPETCPEDDRPKDHLDPEATLVHELLHLAFPPDSGNECSVALEQAIDATARALVNLHRGVRR